MLRCVSVLCTQYLTLQWLHCVICGWELKAQAWNAVNAAVHTMVQVLQLSHEMKAVAFLAGDVPVVCCVCDIVVPLKVESDLAADPP
jgi:hypothetical protein